MRPRRSDPASATRDVADAARALVRALGIRWGEVTVRVSDGGVVLIRHGETFLLEEPERAGTKTA